MRHTDAMTSPCAGSHSSMVLAIENGRCNTEVKRLEKLALDIICTCVSVRLSHDLTSDEMLLVGNLPLPHHMISNVVDRLDYVVRKYFELFVEPEIVFDREEKLSISNLFR